MKKVIVLVLALIVVTIAALVLIVFGATKPVVEAADRFLSFVGEGKIHDAYLATSTSLQSKQDEASFGASVKALGLDGYESSSWSSREMSNDTGKVEGTVKTKSGSEIRLTIHLVEEKDEWRVNSFGRTGSTASAPIPNDEEVARMASSTVGAFADAIQAKDFTAFHQTLGAAFRQQKTPEDLASIFHEFIDRGTDLSGVKTLSPVFDKPPATNEDGQLVLTGYFPTEGSRTKFDLNYAYEHPDWKLVGIRVRTE